jgi:hypothetical protein
MARSKARSSKVLPKRRKELRETCFPEHLKTFNFWDGISDRNTSTRNQEYSENDRSPLGLALVCRETL